MHLHDVSTEVLTQAIIRYAVTRMQMDAPLDKPRSYEELRAMCGATVTPRGIGGLEALRVFADILAPACISADHVRNLSFVPCAPSEAAVLFDLVVGASSIFAGSWMEGAGAVFAENEALRYLSDLAGMPAESGGVFVSGGTAGNLSALIAARFAWRHQAGGAKDRVRGAIVASAGAHSSVASAARAMDADVIAVDDDETGRMTAAAMRAALERIGDEDRGRVFAVVATAGTTNAGVIDDLHAAADAAAELGAWYHVDGAYGAAALAAPSVREQFRGIERCDSLIVDPHKWLFAPFDCCALLYRNPAIAGAAHTQHAEYLDVLHRPGSKIGEWNPSDYAHHLSRRARGLPFWFSLATHGTAAYTQAIEETLELSRRTADLIEDRAGLELIMEPVLSVLLFRRVGWGPDEYREWSKEMLRRQEAFITPTSWRGETLLRFCIVNPLTTLDDIRLILDSLE